MGHRRQREAGASSSHGHQGSPAVARSWDEARKDPSLEPSGRASGVLDAFWVWVEEFMQKMVHALESGQARL